jgi:hypothetical protein
MFRFGFCSVGDVYCARHLSAVTAQFMTESAAEIAPGG